MSLLTVDYGGASETAVPFQRAGHNEPRQVGKRRFAFAGNERSMIRAEPMVVAVLLANIPASTMATIRALFAEGATVTCEGDVFNNGNLPVSCTGEITDEMEVGGAYWFGTLTLTESSAATGGAYGIAVNTGGTGTASVTINGPRRFTLSAAGLSSASAAIVAIRRNTATAAGAGTATVVLTGNRITQAISGRATTTVTLTKIP